MKSILVLVTALLLCGCAAEVYPSGVGVYAPVVVAPAPYYRGGYYAPHYYGGYRRWR